jgi:hypothetical protein
MIPSLIQRQLKANADAITLLEQEVRISQEYLAYDLDGPDEKAARDLEYKSIRKMKKVIQGLAELQSSLKKDLWRLTYMQTCIRRELKEEGFMEPLEDEKL